MKKGSEPPERYSCTPEACGRSVDYEQMMLWNIVHHKGPLSQAPWNELEQPKNRATTTTASQMNQTSPHYTNAPIYTQISVLTGTTGLTGSNQTKLLKDLLTCHFTETLHRTYETVHSWKHVKSCQSTTSAYCSTTLKIMHSWNCLNSPVVTSHTVKHVVTSGEFHDYNTNSTQTTQHKE